MIHAARAHGVEKLLFLSSSWYAVAKIAGMKLCQAYRRQYGCEFISAMLTNLHGPGVMDVSRLRALGWQARTPLEEGFRKAFDC